MADANEWLEEWIDNNLNAPLYHEHKGQMSAEAQHCRAQAEIEGITAQSLEEAAGGDLLQYLFDRQNSLTDAEVRRKVAEDRD